MSPQKGRGFPTLPYLQGQAFPTGVMAVLNLAPNLVRSSEANDVSKKYLPIFWLGVATQIGFCVKKGGGAAYATLTIG